MTKRKKTVGAEAVERLAKKDTKQGIVDTEREANKEYIGELQKCVDAHAQWDDPFYVVVHQKKEQLLENVIRRYFIARQSLPTPQWDQDVWRYDPKTGNMQYLWTLPDENTAKWMAGNPQDIHPEQLQLLQFVLNFLDKKLYRFYHNQFHKGEKECTDLSDSPYADVCSKAAQDISNAAQEAESAPKKLIVPE